MAASYADVAATAKSAPQGACEPAPLPAQLQEIYYDDGISYLGYVGEARSVCSDSQSDTNSVAEEDEGFDERVNPEANQVATASPIPTRERSLPSVPRMRNNVYALRVMPEWAYQYTAPPPVAYADWSEFIGTSDEPVPEAMAYEPAFEEADAQFDGAAAAAPAAPQAAPAGVMCCYWKQGHCSMGSSCWYAHEGSASTPCHYGASCRKGHRHLVRANAAPPAQKETAVPKRYVHEPKAPRPSAPLLNTDMPCPQCGETGSVRTQDFPLFEGNRVRQATRGHCGSCMRTFLLQ